MAIDPKISEQALRDSNNREVEEFEAMIRKYRIDLRYLLAIKDTAQALVSVATASLSFIPPKMRGNHILVALWMASATFTATVSDIETHGIEAATKFLKDEG